jgi:hypothetical protein
MPTTANDRASLREHSREPTIGLEPPSYLMLPNVQYPTMAAPESMLFQPQRRQQDLAYQAIVVLEQRRSTETIAAAYSYLHRLLSALLHGCCTRIPPAVSKLHFGETFPAKQRIPTVEPRGFEPLTSAVQRRTLNVAVVRRCLEIPANKPIIPKLRPPMFAVVRLGWCQIGVNCRCCAFRPVVEAPRRHCDQHREQAEVGYTLTRKQLILTITEVGKEA